MCLAKVYLSNSDNNPFLQDIAHMRVRDDCIELETLFGEEKIIPGKVVEIDFSNSRILLDKDTGTDKV